MRTDNPVTGAKRIKYKSDGHRTWTEDDIAAFRKHWPIGKPQRLAMEVLLHTGLRRSDAVRMGWQHATGGAFVITARKTGAELHIPVHIELARFLQSCPERRSRRSSRPARLGLGPRRHFRRAYLTRRPRRGCRPRRRLMACGRQPAVVWPKPVAPRWRSCRSPATPISARSSGTPGTPPAGSCPPPRWISCRRVSMSNCLTIMTG